MDIVVAIIAAIALISIYFSPSFNNPGIDFEKHNKNL
jgi:hypothetical protein